ncbi:Tetratricopeptide domain containing protein [Balamuthia mandrillaris]
MQKMEEEEGVVIAEAEPLHLFHKLPPEVILTILSLLGPKELALVTQLDRFMHIYAEDPSLWRRLYKQTFHLEQSPHHPLPLCEDLTWKKLWTDRRRLELKHLPEQNTFVGAAMDGLAYTVAGHQLTQLASPRATYKIEEEEEESADEVEEEEEEHEDSEAEEEEEEGEGAELGLLIRDNTTNNNQQKGIEGKRKKKKDGKPTVVAEEDKDLLLVIACEGLFSLSLSLSLSPAPSFFPLSSPCSSSSFCSSNNNNKEFASAIALNPDDVTKCCALSNWASALSTIAQRNSLLSADGDMETADKLFHLAYQKFKESFEISPDYSTLNNWGLALSVHTKLRKDLHEVDSLFDAAYQKFSETIALQPAHPDAWLVYTNWSNAYREHASRHDGEKASQLFHISLEKIEEAAKLRADDPDVLSDWADALSEYANSRHGQPGSDDLFLQSYEKYEAACQALAALRTSATDNNNGDNSNTTASTPSSASSDSSSADHSPRGHEDVLLSNWGLALSDHAMIQQDRGEAERLFALSCDKFREAIRLNPRNRLTLCNWAMTLVLRAYKAAHAWHEHQLSRQCLSEARRMLESNLAASVGGGRGEDLWSCYCMARLCSVAGEEEACKQWLLRCGNKVNTFLAKVTRWQAVYFGTLEERPWFRALKQGDNATNGNKDTSSLASTSQA